ncbi:hypothetical protein B0H14DRAFT_2659081 [Mycena olivaceomarginata]|nr:hypothetical protein B0H14DRAFT_2659081 [Mycena olivaceomarginata]
MLGTSSRAIYSAHPEEPTTNKATDRVEKCPADPAITVERVAPCGEGVRMREADGVSVWGLYLSRQTEWIPELAAEHIGSSWDIPESYVRACTLCTEMSEPNHIFKEPRWGAVDLSTTSVLLPGSLHVLFRLLHSAHPSPSVSPPILVGARYQKPSARMPAMICQTLSRLSANAMRVISKSAADNSRSKGIKVNGSRFDGSRASSSSRMRPGKDCVTPARYSSDSLKELSESIKTRSITSPIHKGAMTEAEFHGNFALPPHVNPMANSEDPEMTSRLPLYYTV